MTATALHTPSASIGDYITLLKPGVMSLVLFSGITGMLLAPSTSDGIAMHPFFYIITMLCIAGGSGAGAAINMWYDRDIDSIMKRTQNRPIPAGRIAPADALILGIMLAVTSVMLLILATNLMAGALLAFAIFFYAVIYTQWLKRTTPHNIVIGGAAGAFPPVIGWLAITGTMSVEPWLLFAIIFLWTPPHFWALALYRNQDYADANVPMLPVTNGVHTTKRHMLAYSVALFLCSLAPYFAGMSGSVYLLAALILGGYFLFLSVRLFYIESPAYAMKLFGFSILYLFFLFASMLLDLLITF